MPKTEDYLAAIRDARQERGKIDLDFEAIPQGVDLAAIRGELTKDLPEAYAPEITETFRTGKGFELDFGQALPAPGPVDAAGAVLGEGARRAGELGAGIREAASAIGKQTAESVEMARALAVNPAVRDLARGFAREGASKAFDFIRGGAGGGPLDALAALHAGEERILESLPPSATGPVPTRKSFERGLEEGLAPAREAARGLAPVEEGPQGIGPILERTAAETFLAAGGFITRQIPVTPLEVAEFVIGVKLIGAAAGELARQYPRAAAFLMQEAPDLRIPKSVQTVLNTWKFKVKRAFGVPQETGLTVQDTRVLAEALSESTEISPAAQMLRVNLREQGIGRADLIRADSRLRAEMNRVTGQGSQADDAVRAAADAPEETIIAAAAAQVPEEAAKPAAKAPAGARKAPQEPAKPPAAPPGAPAPPAAVQGPPGAPAQEQGSPVPTPEEQTSAEAELARPAAAGEDFPQGVEPPAAPEAPAAVQAAPGPRWRPAEPVEFPPGQPAFIIEDPEKGSAAITESSPGEFIASLGGGVLIPNPETPGKAVFPTMEAAAKAAEDAVDNPGRMEQIERQQPAAVFDEGQRVVIDYGRGVTVEGIVQSKAYPGDLVSVKLDDGTWKAVKPGLVTPATPRDLAEPAGLPPEEAGATIPEEARRATEEPVGTQEGEAPAGAGGTGPAGAPGVLLPQAQRPGPAAAAPGPGEAEGAPGEPGETHPGRPRRGGKAPAERGGEPGAGGAAGPGDDRPPVPGVRPGVPGAGEQPGQPAPARVNHRIAPDAEVPRTPVQKYDANVAAIRLLKDLEKSGRAPTPDEKALLAKYTGWGSLPQVFKGYGEPAWVRRGEEIQGLLTDRELEAARASTKNAHYTSYTVIAEIYKGLQRLGFTGGRILEPALGVGNFFGLVPEELAGKVRLSGVELDDLTGRIARQLYPEADIRIMGFEDARYPDGFFDVNASNVPFGNYPVADRLYRGTGMTGSIHNYFFAKALDKTRPGGLVVFVTSRYTLDEKDSKARGYIAERADLIAAYRMPDTAFKENAGTEVVTDLIILRKKVPGEEFKLGHDFLKAVEVRDERTGEFYNLNTYYQVNPKHMLGRPVIEGGQRSARDFVLKSDGRKIEDALASAMADLPKDVMAPAAAAPEAAPREMIPAPGDVKEGGLAIIEGKVHRRVGEEMIEVPGLSAPRVKAALKVRDAVREVQRAQIEDKSDAEIKKLQKELEKAYDSFVSRYGNFGERATANLLRGDPDFPLLRSLETVNKETGAIEKADIFTKRVITPVKRKLEISTAPDALIASLNQSGKVDLPAMSKMLGRPEDAIAKELAGTIFRDPEKGWVQAENYLSGDVRAKLAAAKSAAASDPAFKANVEALEAVQPKDLEPGDIEVRAGAPWVPAEDVAAFAQEKFEAQGVKVIYIPETGAWLIEMGRSTAWHLDSSVANNNIFGTERMPAINILRDTLNGKIVTVYDSTGDGGRVVNPAATEAAREKQNKIKDEFKKWVFEDLERRERLVAYYNENFNNFRPPTHDGSHLDLPGINPIIKLRPHQKNAIWRIVSSGKNVLLSHEVGTGKTLIMIAAGMELRRIGLRKKPMYVVPNKTLQQWEDEFRRAYPAAKILATTEADFTPDKRKFIAARIATGDWDAVIVPHSSFGFIPMSQEYQIGIFEEQIAALEAAIDEAVASGQRRKSPTVKELEKAKARLEARLKRVMDKKKDDAVSFEELGVDHLFVDESHEYGKLFYFTKMTRVAGLGDPDGSQMAFDMWAKTRYINGLTNFSGVTFATGTPIKNTISEMFHVQRFLQGNLLRESGINHFDAWAALFGDTVSRIEMAVEGGGRFRSKTRFSRFINVHELLNRYLEVADVKTAAELGIPRPKLKGGKPRVVVVPQSPEIKEFVAQLGKRADAIRSGKVEKSEDNMLKVSGDGREAALDMRLVGRSQGEEFSKLAHAAKEIAEIYKANAKTKGTQLVFIDFGIPGKPGRFNAYADLRDRLMHLGVPKGEIAFIHDAKDKTAQALLFDRVNSGAARVLIGSGKKMGTGLNVQKRLIALHEVTAPWRPDEVAQAEGRIMRQGNMHTDLGIEVEIIRYVTEGSFDVHIWQLLENKAGFLAQLAPGKLKGRAIEDVDDVVLNFEQVKAIATGDKTIVEKVEVDNEIRRLQMLESEHRAARYRAELGIARLPEQIKALRGVVDALTADKATFAALDFKGFSAEIAGKAYDDREAFGTAVKQAVAARMEKADYGTKDFGTYRGFPLQLRTTIISGAQLQVSLKMAHVGEIGEKAAGVSQSMDHALRAETIDRRIANNEEEIKAREKKLADLKKEVEKTFEHAEALKKLLARKEGLDRKLGINRSDAPIIETEGKPGVGIDEDPPEEAADYGDYEAVADRGPSARPGAAIGPFQSEFRVELGGMETIRPMEMPEIVELTNELAGQYPKIVKRDPSERGSFNPGKMLITLNFEIFKDPREAAQVLAHEVGHLFYYLGHLVNTMKRGNLLGAVHSLNNHLKNTYGASVVTNKELREELIALSEWWRPYDKAGASDSFKAYRNSAPELYADAVSVLLNSPGTLERLAPKFYKEFFGALDKKPDVKQSFFELQDLLAGRGVDLAEHREQRVREMFQKGEDLMRLKHQQRQLASSRFWEQLRQYLDERYYPILKKISEAGAAGRLTPDEADLPAILQESQMYANDQYLLLWRIDQQITRPLAEAGVTLKDLGVILFNDRILGGDRSGIANPLGHNPDTARVALQHLMEKMGVANFRLARSKVQKLHDMNYALVQRAVELGVYNAEMFENKIKPNRNFYASFQVLDFIDDFVSAAVKTQIGTLKEIGDPLISTTLKMLSLIQANARQEARLSFVNAWKRLYPDEIKKLKPINPQDRLRQFRPSEGMGALTLLDDGHVIAYEVDPYIVDAFDKHVDVLLPFRILGWISSNVFHPLLITYQPGFFLMNLVRDIIDTWRSLGSAHGITVGQLLKELWKQWPEARARAAGVITPLMEEMLESKALQTPLEDFVLGANEDQYARMLKAHNLLPEAGQNPPSLFRQALERIIGPIRRLGQTVEALSKIAGYNLRKRAGERGHELPYNTRTYDGTPPWMVKGVATGYTNSAFMFSNIFLQGMKRTAALATMPKTRGGWWWRTAQVDLTPKLLMALAAGGYLGSELKDLYDRMTEYDKTNYITLPLGKIEGGPYGYKVVYMRIPHPQDTRVLAGLFWKIIGSGKNIPQILDFGSEQLPNVSPAITIADGWKDYMTGRNPIDSFRGRTVMSETEFKAGGWPKLKKMVQWTINQTGFTRFATYSDSEKTTFEATLQWLPIVNRLIRVTDYGLTEKERELIAEQESEDARFRLKRTDEVREFLNERYRLQRLKAAEQLSDAGLNRLAIMDSFHSRVVDKLTKGMRAAIDAGDQAEFERLKKDLQERVIERRPTWRAPSP